METTFKNTYNIICNDGYTKSIHIFDLFCGPGIYENNGEGSPIIALRKIKQTFFQFIDKRPDRLPKIHCYFNDLDKEKLETLNHNITQNNLYYSSYGNLNLSNEDYTDLVNELPKKLKMFKDSKAFIFIDPYGYKDAKS